MLKEKIDDLIVFLVGGMLWPISHGHPVFVTQDLIDGNGVVEWDPPFHGIFRPARHQEGTGCHQRMDFMKVMAVFQQFRI